jgi:hypothetical protein
MAVGLDRGLAFWLGASRVVGLESDLAKQATAVFKTGQ